MSISRVHASSSSSLVSSLVANRMTGQFQKDIFKVRENRAELRDPDPILGKALNHLGDEIVASSPNGELRITAGHCLDARNRSEAFHCSRVVCGEDDGSLRAMPLHKVLRP